MVNCIEHLSNCEKCDDDSQGKTKIHVGNELFSHTIYDQRENLTIIKFHQNNPISSVQFSRSVVSDCDPMNCSMPGLPVHHQLPEFTQTHIQRVGDAIQPSHPPLSPSPPAPNPSQHQSLFQ